MNVHDAAVAASVYAITEFPDWPMPHLLQVAGKGHVLTVSTIDVALLLRVAQIVVPGCGATSVTFVADSYRATAADDAEVERYERGNLQERFEAGDPGVTEAVTICTAYRLGVPRLTICDYTRTPEGIAWASPHDGGAREGRVIDALRTALMAEGPPEAPSDERVRFETVAQAVRIMGGDMEADVTPLP